MVNILFTILVPLSGYCHELIHCSQITCDQKLSSVMVRKAFTFGCSEWSWWSCCSWRGRGCCSGFSSFEEYVFMVFLVSEEDPIGIKFVCLELWRISWSVFPTGNKTLLWRHNDVSLHVPATSHVHLKWNHQRRLGVMSSRLLCGTSSGHLIGTSWRHLKIR